LAVIPLSLPPLRERRGDIPLIATQLLARVGAKAQRELTSDAMQALAAHDWPGNVRELRNVLERSALWADAAGDLNVRVLGLPVPSAPAAAAANTQAAAFDPSKSYRETREVWEQDFECKYVAWLLAAHEGNVSSAARAADMDRKYLYKLAKKHGLRD
jgi:DNA-binding NtrC family response regulator